jgi:glycosyltransferase involved in cell wall biosynthesis
VRLPTSDPRQLRVLHIGGYWRGPNDMVRHMMLGLRSAGARVLEFCTDQHPQALDTEGRVYDRGTSGPVWLRREHLQRRLEDLAPHLVVCNAGGLSFRPDDAARLRETMTLLGIALSDPGVFERATRHISRAFDLFLTNDPGCVARHAAAGARARELPIATNEEFYRPLPPREEMRCQVLVLGRAHADRVEPVKALVREFDTHVYGEGWDEHGVHSRGTIYGQDVLAALASAAATVVFFLNREGDALVKVGLFDFAAAGGLVVTNRFPAVEQYLEFGRELVGFASTDDLLRQVRRLLDHPEEAAAIRRAGRERVLREHTWRRVWPRILGWLAEGDGP